MGCLIVQIMVMRCTNGIVTWTRVQRSHFERAWRCNRDGFFIASPQLDSDVEPQLQKIIQHSVGLAGALQQIVELDV